MFSHQTFSIASTTADETLLFVGAAYNIPKSKTHPTEDAYFITDIGAGVSDGVGGWSSYGINTSLFSQTLMLECEKFISRVIDR